MKWARTISGMYACSGLLFRGRIQYTVLPVLAGGVERLLFSKRKIFAPLEEAGCLHRKSSRKNLLLIINKTKK